MNNYTVRVRVAFETQRIQGSERDWLVAGGGSEGRGRKEVDYVYAVGLFYYAGCRDSRTFHRSSHYSSVCRALESATIRFTIWILLSLSE